MKLICSISNIPYVAYVTSVQCTYKLFSTIKLPYSHQQSSLEYNKGVQAEAGDVTENYSKKKTKKT
jgi:hypothetical protein